MENQFIQITALMGDPVRAKILWALMDKRAYTATELAIYTDTTPQNISMHLNKLVKANLLTVESQGRHKYYNYSRAEIADAIETLAALLPKTEIGKNNADENPVKYCRSCYDHLAGKVGVMLTDGLISQHFVTKGEENNFAVTCGGEKWFNALGIDTGQLKKLKRSFARPCLDWSERKHHLGGALGAALLHYMINDGWLRRVEGSRTITVTRKGEQAFLEYLKINIR